MNVSQTLSLLSCALGSGPCLVCYSCDHLVSRKHPSGWAGAQPMDVVSVRGLRGWVENKLFRNALIKQCPILTLQTDIMDQSGDTQYCKNPFGKGIRHLVLRKCNEIKNSGISLIKTPERAVWWLCWTQLWDTHLCLPRTITYLLGAYSHLTLCSHSQGMPGPNTALLQVCQLLVPWSVICLD